jgi:hypothetical protein
MCREKDWNPNLCSFMNKLLSEWGVAADERNALSLETLAAWIGVEPGYIANCVAGSQRSVACDNEGDAEDEDELVPSDASDASDDESEYTPSVDQYDGSDSEDDGDAGSAMDESADNEDWDGQSSNWDGQSSNWDGQSSNWDEQSENWDED